MYSWMHSSQKKNPINKMNIIMNKNQMKTMKGQQRQSKYTHCVLAAAPFPAARFTLIDPQIFTTAFWCNYVMAAIPPSLAPGAQRRKRVLSLPVWACASRGNTCAYNWGNGGSPGDGSCRPPVDYGTYLPALQIRGQYLAAVWAWNLIYCQCWCWWCESRMLMGCLRKELERQHAGL